MVLVASSPDRARGFVPEARISLQGQAETLRQRNARLVAQPLPGQGLVSAHARYSWIGAWVVHHLGIAVGNLEHLVSQFAHAGLCAAANV